MLGLPDIAVGAILAALITGIVSLLGLIISKEQKISEFRQAWIDALRTELSALISHANAIHGAGAAGFKSASETWEVVRADFVGINDAAARIRIRLNPREPEDVKVLSQIEALEQLLAPGNAPDHARINEAEKELVGAAQIVLKREWKRVRQGERAYRITQFVVLCVIVTCVLVLFAFFAVRFWGQ